MKGKAAWGAPATIRVRLGLALAITLLPVLALGIGQSVFAFREDAEARRAGLVMAAERSAASARARVEAGAILLETLEPGAVGLQCAQRLSQVAARVPGYANLIRFDRIGRVVCAAASTPEDPQRRYADWFQRLQKGDRFVITQTPAGQYGPEPMLLAATPSFNAQGQADGALAAVIHLSSLRPELSDRSLPDDTQVALLGKDGGYISRSDAVVFQAPPPNWFNRDRAGSFTYRARDGVGRWRVYAAAPLVGDDLYVLMSAPRETIPTWAKLNVLSSIVPPILSFFLALGAVWVVSELVVIRWLHYLQRIAAIYARGRFSVRPLLARRAPPEIRQLAETLDIMADAIVARDHSLHESLDQKDRLMREIHHRVKNNLQIISSLINMQMRTVEDGTTRDALEECKTRVLAMALIHEKLYQSKDYARVQFADYVRGLATTVFETAGVSERDVALQLAIDDVSLPIDRAIPCGLIINELITNSLKHGFKDGRTGTIWVTLSHLDPTTLRLSVRDDGIGLSPGFTMPTAESTGIGLYLVKMLSRQLGATVVVDGSDGAAFELTFPTEGS